MDSYNNHSFFNDLNEHNNCKNKCCSNCCEHNNDHVENYESNKINSSCSVESIKEALLAIFKTVKDFNSVKFSVDVEITTKNGVTYVVKFGKPNTNNLKIKETVLTTDDLIISICDIVKINVLSSTLYNPIFNARLLRELRRISSSNSNNSCHKCNCSKGSLNIKCAQGIQNYINQNIDDIETVSYTGSIKQTNIKSIDKVETVNILEDVTLSNTKSPVLNSANLESSKTTINEYKPLNTNIVKEITSKTESLLSNIKTEQIDVASSIKVSPVSLISEITTTDQNEIVTKVDSTKSNAIKELTKTNGLVVTGFQEGTTINGVLSGIDKISTIKPTEISIPTITCNKTGQLVVKIKKGSFGGNFPTQDLTLNVTVDDSNISFDGNVSHFVLPNGSNLLGGLSSTPSISSIKQQGQAITDTFLKDIKTTSYPFVDTVTSETKEGTLIENIERKTINNIEQPTNVSVIKNITGIEKNINTIDVVKNSSLDTLFTKEQKSVLDAASIKTTTKDVVDNNTISKKHKDIKSVISEKDQKVFSPDYENIHGEVIAAGDGIMTVNNTNNNISIYAICDINTVTI